MIPAEHPPVLIACGILRSEILALADQGRIKAATHFLHPRLHSNPLALEKALAAAMNYFGRQNGHRVVVAYGDACLGLTGKMLRLVESYNFIKINAVNCIDCLLGGCGRILQVDPDQRFFFLNRAFLEFGRNSLFTGDPTAVRKLFGNLSAIVPLDCRGDLKDYAEEIRRVCDATGLPLGESIEVGLEGVEKVIVEAIARLAAV